MIFPPPLEATPRSQIVRSGLALSHATEVTHGLDPMVKLTTLDRPPELLAFAKRAVLPEADVEMLARAHSRGQHPRTEDDWSSSTP